MPSPWTFLHRLPRFNHSLKNKLGLLFSFAIAVPLVISGWYGYTTTSRSLIADAEMVNIQELQDISNNIVDILEEGPKDLHFLSEFYALTKYLHWTTVDEPAQAQRWLHHLTRAFSSFLESKEIYAKVRLLDPKGMEQIRIDFDPKNHRAITIPQQKMQNKLHRPYYSESVRLKRGQVHISPLDLNQEWGKLERPLVPVIRFATPLYDQDEMLRGVLILNMYGNTLLDIIHRKMARAKSLGSDAQFILTNGNGHYLHHPDKNKEWGWQLGHSYNLKADHPNLFAITLNPVKGAIRQSGSLFFIKKVPILPGSIQQRWFLIKQQDEAVMLSPLRRFNALFILTVIGIFVLVMLVSRWVVGGFLKPLKQAAAQLKKLSTGRVPLKNISYKHSDEVGEIIISIRKLKESFHATIHQANLIASGDYTQNVKLLSRQDQLGQGLNEMTYSLRQVAEVMQSVAAGDYRERMPVRSERDRLAHAVNQMIETLEEAGEIAQAVAGGQYKRSMNIKGKKDVLGRAMVEMTGNFREVVQQAKRIAKGDFSADIQPKSDQDALGKALLEMTRSLRALTEENAQETWIKTGQANLNACISDEQTIEERATAILHFLADFLSLPIGLLYWRQSDETPFSMLSSYAHTNRKHLNNTIKEGEGLVGQAALEAKPILLTQVPDDYITIESGLGSTPPRQILVIPLLYGGRVRGVIELGSLLPFSGRSLNLLERVGEATVTAMVAAESLERTKILLVKTQQQADALQSQTEELQTQTEELQSQQEELRMANDELGSRTEQLEQQKSDIEEKNNALNRSRKLLEEKAKELEIASRYKSEFLANMSHELRTPLNSILILSNLLSDNMDGNLTEKQTEFASTIQEAGRELMELIDEVLDMAKVEAGHMEPQWELLDLASLASEMRRRFTPMANTKSLQFETILQNQIPRRITTDSKRVRQILKNFLANAFKFTGRGGITLSIGRPTTEIYAYKSKLDRHTSVAFVVTDTGIGISSDKQEQIFHPFQQADGTTSRRYGGTGLGLSIAKKFSELLKGEIHLRSTEGQGSIFTLILPERPLTEPISYLEEDQPDLSEMPTSVDSEILPDVEINSAHSTEQNVHSDNENRDRTKFLKGKKILLVDDDMRNVFSMAGILEAHDATLIVGRNGQEGLQSLKENPDIELVLMDIMMPEMDGYEAIRTIRTQKKHQKLPIIALTAKAMKDDRRKCIDAGASDYLAKPVENQKLLSLMRVWLNQ
ncbi:MAG: response regulator [Magnetococcales bacterium]|nr:response regulator [Magnetococcales bacterium]